MELLREAAFRAAMICKCVGATSLIGSNRLGDIGQIEFAKRRMLFLISEGRFIMISINVQLNEKVFSIQQKKTIWQQLNRTAYVEMKSWVFPIYFVMSAQVKITLKQQVWDLLWMQNLP